MILLFIINSKAVKLKREETRKLIGSENRKGKKKKKKKKKKSEMTIMAKKKKKKGRPSLLDLQKRSIKKQNQQKLLLQRKHPNFSNPREREFVAGDEEDERTKKKHKLLLGFDSGSDRNPTTLSDILLNHDASKKVVKETEFDSAVGVQHDLQVDSGPTALPDKKLLVFILDRLQKKDTYGVFSEPVDPDQIPDYHEIIANPMDFGTMRNKLNSGAYLNLEQFEKDVLLICSNGMEYNSEDTIYFRQARTIQELAEKDFENLREESEDESDDGEEQEQEQEQQIQKVTRRGRPPGKKKSKPEPCPSYETVTPSSNSKNYNLRKLPTPNRFRLSDTVSFAPETCPTWVSEWENEFPSSVVKNLLRYGSKQFCVDENKRDTYSNSWVSSTDRPSPLSLLEPHQKRLVEVGDPYVGHSYARSLCRFSAGLGPVVRKFASVKIARILSAGSSPIIDSSYSSSVIRGSQNREAPYRGQPRSQEPEVSIGRREAFQIGNETNGFLGETSSQIFDSADLALQLRMGW